MTEIKTPTPTGTLYHSLDAATKYRTVLLKGPSGSGKTTKAAEFPSPVFFNFDSNLSGLQKLPRELQKNIRIVQPKLELGTGRMLRGLGANLVWDNFMKQLEQVLKDVEVKTIIIDSVTTMAETLFDKILGTGDPSKKIEIQHWGDFQRYLKFLGEEILCSPALDKHVIFIFHEQLETDSRTQQQTLTLSIGGKMRTSFDLYFTDVWRVFTAVVGNDTVYKIRTTPGPNFPAKCSIPGLPAEIVWDKEKELVLKHFR